MKIISHRGNLTGRDPKTENKIDSIIAAIERGFDVEIDVWFIDNHFYLGHDNPVTSIDVSFLNNKNLWCHAKNKEALEKMLELNIHCFWHENDRMTITSRGVLWCYPGNYSKYGITVDLNTEVQIITEPFMGICTDIPELWKKYNKNKN